MRGGGKKAKLNHNRSTNIQNMETRGTRLPSVTEASRIVVRVCVLGRTMLFGQVHGKLVHHFSGVALQCSEQRAAAVDHDEAKLAVVGQQGRQRLCGRRRGGDGWFRDLDLKRGEAWFKKTKLKKQGTRAFHSYLCVEFVVTEVQGGVDGLERLKVDVDLLLFALLCHDGATVHHQTIWWH